MRQCACVRIVWVHHHHADRCDFYINAPTTADIEWANHDDYSGSPIYDSRSKYGATITSQFAYIPFACSNQKREGARERERGARDGKQSIAAAKWLFNRNGMKKNAMLSCRHIPKKNTLTNFVYDCVVRTHGELSKQKERKNKTGVLCMSCCCIKTHAIRHTVGWIKLFWSPFYLHFQLLGF